MIRVSIKQGSNVIVCEFNELCDALKYVETTMDVCESAMVTIQEKE